jgi:DNA-binding transcriptional MocR family regulator
MPNKYESIIHFIKAEANQGKLKPGQKLPSIRALAEKFACNKATVAHAYAQMEQEHLIYSVSKSGYYLVNQAKQGSPNGSAPMIDFASGMPDTEVIPYIDLQHCLNRAIDCYKESLFTNIPPQGIPSLCQSITRYLQNYQVFTKPEQVFITTGLQQALYLLATVPFPNGKTNILVEQPTYASAIEACTQTGVTLLGIRRDFFGINFDELEKLFCTGNIKFFFTVPRFHNPLGTSYTSREKQQLINLANRYDVYIVEDDYLADLETDSKNDPLFSLDNARNRVIYLKSFSKSLLPGLRLGAAVLPELLVNVFRDQKRASDLSTAVLSQGALEIYINSGLIDKHNKLIKQFYQQKMAQLHEACTRSLPPDVKFQIPSTGFYTCMDVPCNAQQLKESLRQHNVWIKNVRVMYLPHFRRENQIRLSISRTAAREIETGIAALAEEIRRLPRQHQSTEELEL